MPNKITLYLLPLALAFVIYQYVIPKKKSSALEILETIPVWADVKKDLMKDAGKELLKFAGIYVGTYFALKVSKGL